MDLSGPGGGGSVDGNPGGYVWQSGSDAATTPESGSYSYMGMGGVDGLAARGCRRCTGAERADRQGQRSAGPRRDAHLLKETARPFPVSIPTATPIGTGIVDAKAALAKRWKSRAPRTVDRWRRR